jgi:hypothetical protein
LRQNRTDGVGCVNLIGLRRAGSGLARIRTPIRAPQANAIAERFVGTVRRECLDRMLTLSRRQLEATLRVYACHYNSHRPHERLAWDPLPSPASSRREQRPCGVRKLDPYAATFIRAESVPAGELDLGEVLKRPAR